jgi:hypothetical protein
MPSVSKGEVWLVDFGTVAKVRPALLLTGLGRGPRKVTALVDPAGLYA